MDAAVAIRCTVGNCSCECFAPGRGTHLRTCVSCGHGWISHALDKLLLGHLHKKPSDAFGNAFGVGGTSSSGVHSNANAAFDVASLILYGTSALPIRLKILLDRLLRGLQQSELLQLLTGFGWTLDDYSRGYQLQDSSGASLTRWTIVNKEDESLVMQQFLKFAETKSAAQSLLEGNSSSDSVNTDRSATPTTKSHDSDIRKFIEKANNRRSSGGSSQQNSVGLPARSSGQNLPPPTSMQQAMSLAQNSSHHHYPGSGTSAPGARSPSPRASPLNRLQSMQQPFLQDLRRHSAPGAKPLPSLASDAANFHSSSLVSPATNKQGETSLAHHGGAQNNHSSRPLSAAPLATNSDLSITDSEDDSNMSEGAINLSQGHYELKERSRKSSNPMKRRWNPVMLSTLTTNPSTGKRRVQCHACFKTFCDKGALKIHFSAVHLREMHKCTVDGCTMMFSSRRSRNRHSANPNPKLHTSSLRRKMNPHDGRSANPFPLMSSSASSILSLASSAPGFGRSPTSFNPQHMESDRHIVVEHSQMTSSSSMGHEGDAKDRDSPDSLRSGCQTPDTYESGVAMSLSKRSKVYHDEEHDGDDLSSNGFHANMDEGMNLAAQREESRAKSVRKRKSQNPTKCAVSLAPGISEYDLQYSSDSSSNDTFVDRADENGLDDSKSDDEDDDDDSLQELINRRQNQLLQEQMRSLDKNRNSLKHQQHSASHRPGADTNDNPKSLAAGEGTTVDLSVKAPQDASENGPRAKDGEHRSRDERNSTHHANHYDREKSVKQCANKSPPVISPPLENPLRHLESLSLGPFSNLAPQNSHFRSSLFGASPSLSFHAPGLGLGISPSPAGHVAHDRKLMKDNIIDYNGELDEDRHLGSAELDGGYGEHVHMGPSSVFRDNSMNSVDIPVDKDNPRRCTACGKIFQNHFGVKTHYQNVHLKLMHKCTVDGCNAAFPSKRSRDRHSANLNLHRKLLSTHSDKGIPYGLDKASGLFPYHPGASIRDEFLSRLYDPQGLPLSLGDLYHGRIPSLGADGLLAAAAASFPGVMPGFPSPFGMGMPPPGALGMSMHGHSVGERTGVERGSPASSVDSLRSADSKASKGSAELRRRSCSSTGSRSDLDGPIESDATRGDAENDDESLPRCALCNQVFGKDVAGLQELQEHYQNEHQDELVKCSNDGCGKLFASEQEIAKHERRCHNHNSSIHSNNKNVAQTTYSEERRSRSRSPSANREIPC